MGRAEAAFRSAFDRLKNNKPNLLPKNSQVTQNNIAREAGLDPSALKKVRFPSLIAEIQLWIDEHGAVRPLSSRQTMIAQRNRNRDLRVRLEEMKIQRDIALGMLAEADMRILALTIENNRLKATSSPSNVTSFKPKAS